MPRHTHATIHLDAIVDNYHLAKQYAPHSNNLAVIKADAYGHGSVQVAKALQSHVPAFAVAIFEEAVHLREAGISKPILVLQGLNSACEVKYAAAHNIWPMLQNQQQLALLLQTPLSLTIKPWIKVDMGMHRLGFAQTDLFDLLSQLKACSWVSQQTVLCSHLPCAAYKENTSTQQQVRTFKQLVEKLKLPASLANSAALMAYEDTKQAWNRPGIMLYGLSPFERPHPQDQHLKPAMTFSSSVIGIRQVQKGEWVGYGQHWQAPKASVIATIAVGYADGYPRHAKNGTKLLINGQLAKLVGRVSMDMITADISQCTDIKVGDPVELWGKRINANEVALQADTIGYQLLTGVSQRVPRQYF